MAKNKLDKWGPVILWIMLGMFLLLPLLIIFGMAYALFG